MTSSIKNTPRLMLFLAYAGIIPFVVLTVFASQKKPLFIDIPINLPLWLGIYAAVILSFLGAVSWGVALSVRTELTSKKINLLLVYGVLPSLLAWFSFLLPINIALALMSALILFAYFVDLKLLSSLVSPHYLRLRFHLSISVATLLVLAAIFV